MKRLALACALLAIMSATPASSERANRGADGLQRDEIVATQSASRSVFAAQKAERTEAEQSGLPSLAQGLKQLQRALRELRAVDAVAPRLQTSEGGSPPGVAELQAQQEQRREARATAFQHACDDVLAKADTVRSKLPGLRAPRQRELAQAVLNRLDALGPMLRQASAEASLPGAKSLDALADRVGAVNEASVAGSSKPPHHEPTFVTRAHHRREIPRVP